MSRLIRTPDAVLPTQTCDSAALTRAPLPPICATEVRGPSSELASCGRRPTTDSDQRTYGAWPRSTLSSSFRSRSVSSARSRCRDCCSTPGGAVRVVLGRLLLLCLLLRSSWLTVEGGRGRRRHSAASPGRTGRRGVGQRGCLASRSGSVSRRGAVARGCRIFVMAEAMGPASRPPGSAQEQVRDRRCWIAARAAANRPLRQNDLLVRLGSLSTSRPARPLYHRNQRRHGTCPVRRVTHPGVACRGSAAGWL
jgi:hypothetical protein